MAYKAKTWNRDISTPTARRTMYGRPIGAPWTFYGTETFVPVAGSMSLVRDYKQRGWNTLPGWKALRDAQGYLPTMQMYESHHRHSQMSSMKMTFIRESAPAMKCEVEYLRMAIQDMLIAGTGFKSTTPEVEAELASRKIRCLEKARDMKVNVAVAFAEGRQTVQMIRDIAKKLGTAYTAFRKGRFKKAAKTLGIQKPVGEAANHWLSYQYGWRPLVSDVVGLAELAAQHIELGGRGHRITVRSRDFTTLQYDQTSSTYQGSTFLSYKTRIKGFWKFESSAGLLLESESSEIAFAAQLGFGATDLALLAWEKTPFSFVFDWFVDVGSWLESVSALQGWKVLAGYVSLKQTFEGEQSIVAPRGWTTPYETVEGTKHVPVKQTHYSRASWLGDIPSIRTPLLDALDAKRLTTLGALFRQRCRGDRAPGAYKP